MTRASPGKLRLGPPGKAGRGTILKMLALTIAAALLVFSGCAKPVSTTSTTTTSGATVTRTTAATSTTTAAVTTAAPKPTAATTGPYGELKIAIASFSGAVLDPTQGSISNNWNLLSPIFDWFLRVKPGGELGPGVVEKWELSGNALTFHFRKGIKFSNGDDLTAEDGKASIERQAAMNRFYVAEIKGWLSSMEVPDPYTLVIRTKGPQPYLPYFLSTVTSGYGQIEPKNYVQKNGIAYASQRPVGSGSWTFVSFSPDDSIVFDAVNNHWRQTPAFKRLTVMNVPEMGTRDAMIKTGMVDLMDTSLESSKSLAPVGIKSAVFDVITVQAEAFGAYDSRAAGMPISDIKVRQALSYAINRDEVIKTYFAGKALPPLPLWSTAYNADDIDIPLWTKKSQESYLRYDPDKAKQLLKEAGYPGAFSNPTIKLWHYPISGADYLPQLAQIVAGYWQAVGVKVEQVPTDWGTMLSIQNVLQSPRMVGATRVHRAGARPTTPRNLNTYMGSTGPNAMLGKSFPQLDKLIEQAGSETDAAKRKALIAEAFTMASDTWTAWMIAQAPQMAALAPTVDYDFQVPALSIVLHAEEVRHGSK